MASSDPDMGRGLRKTTVPLIPDTAAVPDMNPFVTTEAVRFRKLHMTRLGVCLFTICLSILSIRLIFGHMASAPAWVAATAVAVSTLSALVVMCLQRRKQNTWLYATLNLIGAAILTFLLLYYGTDGTFVDLFLLTILVPSLFFTPRWTIISSLGISALSTVPFVWGTTYSETALLGHVLVRVPVLLVFSFCVSLVMSNLRDQWIESSKQRRLGRDFAVVQQLTTYIASTHDIQAICETVVNQIFDSFSYRYVSIYLMRGDKLWLMAQKGYGDSYLQEVPLGKGVMSKVVATGKPLLINDATKVEDFVFPRSDILCEVSAPILRRKLDDPEPSNGMAIGVINVDDTVLGALGVADLNLISTIAGALAVALENANLMGELKVRGERLELVNQVAQAVAAKTDLATVLHAARTSLESMLPLDRITLSLITEDRDFLEIAAVDGLDSVLHSRIGSFIPLGEFQPASVLQAQCLVIPELVPDSPYPFANRMYDAGFRSHVALPLLSREQVVGVFALSSVTPYAYTEKDLPLLESVAPHLATAVQNAQLYRDIKNRAETDNLTKLLNLPTFYSRLSELILEYTRTKQPLTVVMLDLDLFKSYNDSFGHVAGDSVLKQVATLIRHCLRDVDIAARYGGDEFSIVLPGLTAEEALDTIANLCETIGRTPFRPDIQQGKDDGIIRTRGVAMLSASAGLASFPGDSAEAEHLVHLADTALYEAKRRGRNRACAYNAYGPSDTRASDKQEKTRRKRFQGITDTDTQLDATEARESRATSNEYLQAVYAMVSAVELRDGYTHGHSERVAFYAVRLGEALGLNSSELSALRIAGLLHDIGKIALPYDILHKPGKLTDGEWELVRQHPLQGEGILRPLRNFTAVWPMVAAHHENYDGTGYPRKISYEQIPVGGRILRIADTYEVMTVAGRAYQKRAKSPLEAVGELRRCAGTMFDPELVELFIERVIGDPRLSVLYNPETQPLSTGALPTGMLTPPAEKRTSQRLSTLQLSVSQVDGSSNH